MFSHLKYLAAISLVILIGGAVFVMFAAKDFRKGEMLTKNAAQAEATIGSYSGAIWARYAPEISSNPTASPQLANFNAETQRFFKGQTLTKVTIFSPDVTKLYYGSGPEYVTLDGSERVTLFDVDTVLKGTAVSRVLEDVQLTGSTDAAKKRLMVQSIVPLMRAGATTPDAVAEVYIDTSDSWNALNSRLQMFLLSLIGAFVLLIGILLITASRAETIITRQHEINRELIAAAAQAEAQSQDKSQFLASVSHELRTPLNAIIGFSEIVRAEAKAKLDKVSQDYIEDINASGKHLLSLINDILDFSKAEAGKLQIEWAEADVTKIIHNSLRMVMPRAEAAQVMLIEDLPQNHLVIVTDPKKLKQVLLNLLSNAVKFTPAGGEVACNAWTDVVSGALHIQVRDTGIGIAPKDISRVMTPFGQVDSALSRKYEGTGLGLPLSKKFVESMGGVFAIESELKVGTSVTITFPKAPPGWGTAGMNDHHAPAKDSGNVAPEHS